ncbi:MAG: ATP-binding protein [Elusimicrobia bacterium]|nr:ATP-binding protein [Elusimicrobiota bacterium]
MKLPMLDRKDEMRRLNAAMDAAEASFVCVYGRRRCGKSRLLREAFGKRRCAYYVGDDRNAGLQKQSLAKAVAELVPGFDRVDYPDWGALLDRWWEEAPPGGILAFDEFPALVAAAPEIPSLLQKNMDRWSGKPVHTVVCGSSQRMMQGLVLDRTAPLYGRAREIIEVKPLEAHWLVEAFGFKDPRRALDAYSIWGGVPRYWELALDFPSHRQALRSLVLDPMGVLHQEPRRLLLDDMRDVTQAASILALIGQGCHRLSEIAGRLGKPATSLSRPLSRLVELGLVSRDIPFGAPERDSKRSTYRIGDPFSNFWFRWVEPNRSRLEAGRIVAVDAEIEAGWPRFLGEAWERLARTSVPRHEIGRTRWRPASRWWGPGMERKRLEVDIVALSEDKNSILVGEAKLALAPQEWRRVEQALSEKAKFLPHAGGRRIVPCVWTVGGRKPDGVHVHHMTCTMVLSALR